MVIADCDLEEVKSQYEELMNQSRERFPDIAEFMLHTACIDWLNKEFNPDYETDLLSIDMSKLGKSVFLFSF
jgi:hypothetical protein